MQSKIVREYCRTAGQINYAHYRMLVIISQTLLAITRHKPHRELKAATAMYFAVLSQIG